MVAILTRRIQPKRDLVPLVQLRRLQKEELRQIPIKNENVQIAESNRRNPMYEQTRKSVKSDISEPTKRIEKEQVHIVKCLTGEYANIQFPIESELAIGRNREWSDIYMADTKVSRQHCHIFVKDMEAYIEDLDSVNGTYLGDGTRLMPKKPYPLTRGDFFYLVDRKTLFCYE